MINVQDLSSESTPERRANDAEVAKFLSEHYPMLGDVRIVVILGSENGLAAELVIPEQPAERIKYLHRAVETLDATVAHLSKVMIGLSAHYLVDGLKKAAGKNNTDTAAGGDGE